MTAATVMMAAFVVLLGGAVLVIPVSRNRVLAGQVACGVTALSSFLAIGAAVASWPRDRDRRSPSGRCRNTHPPFGFTWTA